MAKLLGGTTIEGLLTVDADIETDEGDVILDSSTNTIDLGVLPTGSGNGLNADLLDGNHAGAFALDGHDHDDSYILESGDTMSGVLTLSDGSQAASRTWVDSNADVPNADYADSAGDADTVDGEHASAFADAGHTHDDRYYTESEADSNFAATGHLHDSRYIQNTGEVTSTLDAQNGILVTRGSDGLTANNSIEGVGTDDYIGIDTASAATGGVLLGYYNAPEVRVGNGNLSDFNWNGDTVATRPWVVGGNIDHTDLGVTSSSDHHSKYTDSEAVSAVNAETTLSVDISGDADTLDGNHATDLAGIQEGDPIPHPVYTTTGDVPALSVGETVYVSGDGLYVEDGM
jgi:hypothetical protein